MLASNLTAHWQQVQIMIGYKKSIEGGFQEGGVQSVQQVKMNISQNNTDGMNLSSSDSSSVEELLYTVL